MQLMIIIFNGNQPILLHARIKKFECAMTSKKLHKNTHSLTETNVLQAKQKSYVNLFILSLFIIYTSFAQL